MKCQRLIDLVVTTAHAWAESYLADSVATSWRIKIPVGKQLLDGKTVTVLDMGDLGDITIYPPRVLDPDELPDCEDCPDPWEAYPTEDDAYHFHPYPTEPDIPDISPYSYEEDH